MFVMSFMPSPLFDVAGLAAGAARVPIRIFFPAVLLGKVLRGTLMAAAGYWGIGIIEDIFELEIIRDITGSTEGKIAIALAAAVVLIAGFFLLRKFRERLAELW
jgi:membrane protein DedA with SNARE-associated domain